MTNRRVRTSDALPSPVFLPRLRGRTVSKAASSKAEKRIYKLDRCAASQFNQKESNRTNLPAVVLGIDIAKLKFDVCLVKELCFCCSPQIFRRGFKPFEKPYIGA